MLRPEELASLTWIDIGWPVGLVRLADFGGHRVFYAVPHQIQFVRQRVDHLSPAELFSTLGGARLLWWGVLANTLFYAMIVWLLVAISLGLRCAIRRQRGLCENCAYPIGISPICTECGSPVAPPGMPAAIHSTKP